MKKTPKTNKTPRGFSYKQFVDRNGNACGIQKSSVATEDCIWFGADRLKVQEFVPHKGWQQLHIKGDYVANQRMHLSKEQVKELLPILRHFAKTGELPE
jgi:hypothetical protein